MIENEVSFEAGLLKALASYQQDEERGRKELQRAIACIPNDCQGSDLLAVLKFCLRSEDPVIEESAAKQAHRLGELGVEVVPDLLRIASGNESAVADHAVGALGAIPGKESVEAIVKVMQSWGNWERIFSTALPAFYAHGLETEGFVDQVDRYLTDICSDPLVIHHLVLNSLREKIRKHHTEELAALSLPAVADLDQIIQCSDCGERWIPINGAAEAPNIQDGVARFRYVSGGRNSEVGLKSEPLTGGSGRRIVTILVDEEWYGSPPMLVRQYLATAIKELYDLEPDKTSWVIHQTPGCAHTLEGLDEFWLLDLTFVPATGHFTGHKRTLYSSMNAVVKALLEEEDSPGASPPGGRD